MIEAIQLFSFFEKVDYVCIILMKNVKNKFLGLESSKCVFFVLETKGQFVLGRKERNGREWKGTEGKGMEWKGRD